MSDQKAEDPVPSYSLNDNDTRPLPQGWVKQFDPVSQAWFYVDTKTSPPRSIWVHPHDDPEYLENRPNVSNDNGSSKFKPPSSPPPGPLSSRPEGSEKDKAPEKRGFFGKMKDKAIGTKEEREESKRLREQERQERLIARQEQLIARQEALARYSNSPQIYQQYPGQGQVQQGYGQPVYVQQQPRRTGGSTALPLLGGLAGGLLLGSVLDGGFGDGFGGGDFGGGDFGGF